MDLCVKGERITSPALAGKYQAILTRGEIMIIFFTAALSGSVRYSNAAAQPVLCAVIIRLLSMTDSAFLRTEANALPYSEKLSIDALTPEDNP